MTVDALEMVVRIVGALVGLMAVGGALVGAYLAGRRGTSRLFERLGALEVQMRHQDVALQRNVPDLWRHCDTYERRLAELERRVAVQESRGGNT